MTNSNDKIYDVAIVGAGPAGLTASIYASRYKLDNAVIGLLPGGQTAEAHRICNWPGETEILGSELAAKFERSAVAQGGVLISDRVSGIKPEAGQFILSTDGGQQIKAKTVLLAFGTEHRVLGLSNENRYLGRGISYCATCDGTFYRGKTVAVVGGGDSALTSALYLSELADKVYVIYRGQQFRAEPIWEEQVLEKSNIEIIKEANVVGLKGEAKLTAVILDRENDKEIAVDGVFVEIGTMPKSGPIKEWLGVETDPDGYVRVSADQKTSVPGVWAAGDITDGSNKFRQIVTAAGEGAVAAQSIFQYFMREEGPR
jgi:thioredoxin reductase (NADPH)